MADDMKAAELADALQDGKWFVWPWEEVAKVGDLEQWKSMLAALCEERQFEVRFIDIKPKNLTVVVNNWNYPPAEVVEEFIMKMSRARWLTERN